MSEFLGVGPSLTQLPDTFGWSKTLGDFVERGWKGSESAVRGVAADLKGQADSFKFTNRGSCWELSAQFSRNPDDTETEIPERTIRVVGGSAHKSIFTPRYFPSITQAHRKLTKDAVDGLISSDDFNPFGFASGDEATQIAILYHLGKMKEDSVLSQTYHVFLTQTASRGFQFPFNFDNTGLILTTGAMMEEVGIADGEYPLPAFTFDNTTANLPAGLTFVYGWYKYLPELSISTSNKRNFSAQYEYGLWPTPPYETE
jgi:hypothetical protein